MKIMKVLLFFSFSWSTFSFRLLQKLVKLLKKSYINLVPSVLIECNTTPLVCQVSEKIILFCALSSINWLIRNLKVLIKLLFIGRCDKSTETSSFVGWAVTRSSLEREVRSLNLGPVKLDTLLPTARSRYNIFSKGAVLPRPQWREMGLDNSSHTSA